MTELPTPTVGHGAALPGSAEWLSTHLTGLGFGCKHLQKYSIRNEQSGPVFPSRLGFFYAAAESNVRISYLDTKKLCNSCLASVVPDGYNCWLTLTCSPTGSQNDSFPPLRLNASPSSDNFPLFFQAGTEGLFDLHGVPRSAAKLGLQASAPVIVPIPQLPGLKEAWDWIQCQRKPFYIDQLHLTKGWSSLAQRAAERDCIIAQKHGVAYTPVIHETRPRPATDASHPSDERVPRADKPAKGASTNKRRVTIKPPHREGHTKAPEPDSDLLKTSTKISIEMPPRAAQPLSKSLLKPQTTSDQTKVINAPTASFGDVTMSLLANAAAEARPKKLKSDANGIYVPNPREAVDRDIPNREVRSQSSKSTTQVAKDGLPTLDKNAVRAIPEPLPMKNWCRHGPIPFDSPIITPKLSDFMRRAEVADEETRSVAHLPLRHMRGKATKIDDSTPLAGPGSTATTVGSEIFLGLRGEKGGATPVASSKFIKSTIQASSAETVRQHRQEKSEMHNSDRKIPKPVKEKPMKDAFKKVKSMATKVKSINPNPHKVPKSPKKKSKKAHSEKKQKHHGRSHHKKKEHGYESETSDGPGTFEMLGTAIKDEAKDAKDRIKEKLDNHNRKKKKNPTEDSNLDGADDQNQSDQDPGDQDPDDQAPDNQAPDNQNPDNHTPEGEDLANQDPINQTPSNHSSGDQNPDQPNPGNQNSDSQNLGNQNPGDQNPGDHKVNNENLGDHPVGNQNSNNQNPSNRNPNGQTPDNQKPENPGQDDQCPHGQNPASQTPENRNSDDRNPDPQPPKESRKEGDSGEANVTEKGQRPGSRQQTGDEQKPGNDGTDFDQHHFGNQERALGATQRQGAEVPTPLQPLNCESQPQGETPKSDTPSSSGSTENTAPGASGRVGHPNSTAESAPGRDEKGDKLPGPSSKESEKGVIPPQPFKDNLSTKASTASKPTLNHNMASAGKTGETSLAHDPKANITSSKPDKHPTSTSSNLPVAGAAAGIGIAVGAGFVATSEPLDEGQGTNPDLASSTSNGAVDSGVYDNDADSYTHNHDDFDAFDYIGDEADDPYQYYFESGETPNHDSYHHPKSGNDHEETPFNGTDTNTFDAFINPEDSDSDSEDEGNVPNYDEPDRDSELENHEWASDSDSSSSDSEDESNAPHHDGPDSDSELDNQGGAPDSDISSSDSEDGEPFDDHDDSDNDNDGWDQYPDDASSNGSFDNDSDNENGLSGCNSENEESENEEEEDEEEEEEEDDDDDSDDDEDDDEGEDDYSEGEYSDSSGSSD